MALLDRNFGNPHDSFSQNVLPSCDRTRFTFWSNEFKTEKLYCTSFGSFLFALRSCTRTRKRPINRRYFSLMPLLYSRIFHFKKSNSLSELKVEDSFQNGLFTITVMALLHLNLSLAMWLTQNLLLFGAKREVLNLPDELYLGLSHLGQSLYLGYLRTACLFDRGHFRDCLLNCCWLFQRSLLFKLSLVCLLLLLVFY